MQCIEKGEQKIIYYIAIVASLMLKHDENLQKMSS